MYSIRHQMFQISIKAIWDNKTKHETWVILKETSVSLFAKLSRKLLMAAKWQHFNFVSHSQKRWRRSSQTLCFPRASRTFFTSSSASSNIEKLHVWKFRIIFYGACQKAFFVNLSRAQFLNQRRRLKSKKCPPIGRKFLKLSTMIGSDMLSRTTNHSWGIQLWR